MPPKKPLYPEFADRLFTATKRYELRERRDFDRKELARAVGRTEAIVSNWYTGKLMPSVHQLEIIGKMLGVHPGWLAFGEATELYDPDGEEQQASPEPPESERHR